MAPLGSNTAVVISKRCENEFKRNRKNVQSFNSTFTFYEETCTMVSKLE